MGKTGDESDDEGVTAFGSFSAAKDSTAFPDTSSDGKDNFLVIYLN